MLLALNSYTINAYHHMFTSMCHNQEYSTLTSYMPYTPEDLLPRVPDSLYIFFSFLPPPSLSEDRDHQVHLGTSWGHSMSLKRRVSWSILELSIEELTDKIRISLEESLGHLLCPYSATDPKPPIECCYGLHRQNSPLWSHSHHVPSFTSQFAIYIYRIYEYFMNHDAIHMLLMPKSMADWWGQALHRISPIWLMVTA